MSNSFGSVRRPPIQVLTPRHHPHTPTMPSAFAAPQSLPLLRRSPAPRCARRRVALAVAIDPRTGPGADATRHSRLGIHDPWGEPEPPAAPRHAQLRRGADARLGSAAGEEPEEGAGRIRFHSLHIGEEEDGAGAGEEADLMELPTSGEEGEAVPAKPWDSTTGAHGISYLGRRVVYVRRRMRLLQDAYEECRRVTELFSKTFYMGTSLMSSEKRKAVWAVYTWCRRTDELVDGPRVTQRSKALHTVLAEWHTRLDDIFRLGKAYDAFDLALVDVCNNFPEMEPAPFKEMINGMQMDVDLDRFETWDDLYLYCYRVAGTVGLMTLPIMGTVKPGRDGLREASESALALGLALQLTNILRDVGEDRLRGRIYLPLEELRRFDYTPEDLMACVNDARYKALMRFQIARARSYFARAQAGIALLAPDARLPVQASLDMYSQILNVIEENDYDNFHRRAYISKRKKLATIPWSFIRISDNPFAKAFLAFADHLADDTRKPFAVK